jgi:hypothetical protein
MCEYAAEEELKLKEKADYQRSYSKKAVNRFLDEVFEIAFGCSAIDKGYSMKEVVEKLREFSDQALQYDELFDITFRQYSSIDDFEKAKKDFIEENYYEKYL